jgi:hypothetical protein
MIWARLRRSSKGRTMADQRLSRSIKLARSPVSVHWPITRMTSAIREAMDVDAGQEASAALYSQRNILRRDSFPTATFLASLLSHAIESLIAQVAACSVTFTAMRRVRRCLGWVEVHKVSSVPALASGCVHVAAPVANRICARKHLFTDNVYVRHCDGRDMHFQVRPRGGLLKCGGGAREEGVDRAVSVGQGVGISSRRTARTR